MFISGFEHQYDVFDYAQAKITNADTLIWTFLLGLFTHSYFVLSLLPSAGSTWFERSRGPSGPPWSCCKYSVSMVSHHSVRVAHSPKSNIQYLGVWEGWGSGQEDLRLKNTIKDFKSVLHYRTHAQTKKSTPLIHTLNKQETQNRTELDQCLPQYLMQWH